MSTIKLEDPENLEGAITEATLRAAIDELLPTVDLATTGTKKFRSLLSKKKFDGANLKKFSDFITQTLTEAINKQESEAEEESEEEAPKEKKKGGYNKPKELSPKLAKFLKTDELSRPQIVKALWAYIKEHNLQNPNNGQEIVLDGKLRKVFGCEGFDMFTMNKYITHHVHPFPPLDLTKKIKTTPTKKRSAKSSPGSTATKKRKAGTQPPYRLSEAMASVVNREILPRPQVVSKIWEYIRGNNLQNPDNKREIFCDDKLKAIFDGEATVTMFTLNKYISPHMLEKVDRSEYQEDVVESD